MIPKNLKKAKGITLLELLMITVIIGVLLGIAIPTYTKTKFHIKEEKAKYNLYNMYNAQKACYLDNGIYLSAGQESDLDGYGDFVISDEDWTYYIVGADSTTFSISARHIILATPTNTYMYIDQTGSITKSY